MAKLLFATIVLVSLIGAGQLEPEVPFGSAQQYFMQTPGAQAGAQNGAQTNAQPSIGGLLGNLMPNLGQQQQQQRQTNGPQLPIFGQMMNGSQQPQFPQHPNGLADLLRSLPQRGAEMVGNFMSGVRNMIMGRQSAPQNGSSLMNMMPQSAYNGQQQGLFGSPGGRLPSQMQPGQQLNNMASSLAQQASAPINSMTQGLQRGLNDAGKQLQNTLSSVVPNLSNGASSMVPIGQIVPPQSPASNGGPVNVEPTLPSSRPQINQLN